MTRPPSAAAARLGSSKCGGQVAVCHVSRPPSSAARLGRGKCGGPLLGLLLQVWSGGTWSGAGGESGGAPPANGASAIVKALGGSRGDRSGIFL